MSKKIFLVILLSALLTGCIIVPDDGYRHRPRRDRFGLISAPVQSAVWLLTAADETGLART